MNHTKGPWHRNIPPASHYPIIFAGRNTHVARIFSQGLPDSEVEANADLVAGAPALLEAAVQFLEDGNAEPLRLAVGKILGE